jgi:hypothetical protein
MRRLPCRRPRPAGRDRRDQRLVDVAASTSSSGRPPHAVALSLFEAASDAVNVRFHSYPPSDFAVGGTLLSNRVPPAARLAKRLLVIALTVRTSAVDLKRHQNIPIGPRRSIQSVSLTTSRTAHSAMPALLAYGSHVPPLRRTGVRSGPVSRPANRPPDSFLSAGRAGGACTRGSVRPRSPACRAPSSSGARSLMISLNGLLCRVQQKW